MILLKQLHYAQIMLQHTTIGQMQNLHLAKIEEKMGK